MDILFLRAVPVIIMSCRIDSPSSLGNVAFYCHETTGAATRRRSWPSTIFHHARHATKCFTDIALLVYKIFVLLKPFFMLDEVASKQREYYVEPKYSIIMRHLQISNILLSRPYHDSSNVFVSIWLT